MGAAHLLPSRGCTGPSLKRGGCGASFALLRADAARAHIA
jgi:hypothetical protein